MRPPKSRKGYSARRSARSRSRSRSRLQTHFYNPTQSGTAENNIERMYPTIPQSHRSSPKRRVSLCKRWFGFNLCNPWEGGRRTRRYRRASKKQRN